MKEELGKLFRGKMIFGLTLLSVVVNAYLLFMQRETIVGLHLIDYFCMENGRIISDEKTAILAEIWNEKNPNDILWEEFESNIEMGIKYYETIQSGDMADTYCRVMHLEGKASEYVQAEFRKLDGSIRKAAGQELTIFPPYRMRVFDFITTYLLFAMNLEGIVTSVILTLYSVDIERSSRTILTVYSTKKGKKIIKDKLLASVTGSVICFLLIVVITFLLIACVFPVKTIMNTLVSNPMVNLKGAPCITKETMTIGMYIFVSLGMSCILAVIYSLGSFAIGLKARNGYYAFGILIILLGVMKVISSAAPTSTYMFFWTQYNPLDMALKAGTWFLYSSSNFSPLGYEGCTAILWIVLCVIGCISGLRSMEKGGRNYDSAGNKESF